VNDGRAAFVEAPAATDDKAGKPEKKEEKK
jgi:hypothetical protein